MLPWITDVVRYTRHWIHYGAVILVPLLVLIAAAEGLAGK